jgi:transposase-like protein/IS1 family transposase
LTCHSCRTECRKFGKRGNRQRYQCNQCRKVFTDARDNTLEGMYLPIDKAEMVLRLLLEGNSVSSVERTTEVHHTTILKLLVLAGERAERVMAEKIRNVQVRDVECDEVWSFIGKKQKRVRPDDNQLFGDCYVFVGIERHSKLVLNIAIGRRDQSTTDAFVEGLRHVTARSPFQVTTDGFAPYRSAITTTLHDRLTGFAQLVKVYRSSQEGEARYSPAEVASTVVVPVMGQPDPERICTSIVERSNLSLRMGLRRFTRLTNGFSKKWENHCAAVMLWYCWYNFGRVHKSLRTTPAMAAGIADHVWSVRELLEAA